MPSDLEFVLKPVEPFRALPTASTLFGQLVWAAAFQGLDVAALLAPFRQGQPSFLISDAMPTGFFPKPFLPATTTTGGTKERKAYKNRDYFAHEAWRRSLQEGEDVLVRDALDGAKAPSVVAHLTRVGIDRQTLMARDGILIPEAVQHLRNTWSVFVRPLNENHYTTWDLQKRFGELGQFGFGGGASVGRGAFDVVEVRATTLPNINTPNGFTSLCAFVPKGLQPETGHYDLEVYRGRLGGGYNGPDPWKRPYVRVKTGSSFLGDHNAVQGMWVDCLATLDDGSKVGDYAFAYPVGVRL